MRWRAASIVLAANVAALLPGSLAGRSDAATEDAAGRSCGQGSHPDPARSARVIGLVESALACTSASNPDAARLRRAPWRRATLCYAGDSVLREPSRIVLDARLDDRRAAARAVHLLLHATLAPPWPPDSQASCDTRVRRALDAEARAHALEHAAAVALGTLPAPGRTQDALRVAYTERCARERPP